MNENKTYSVSYSAQENREIQRIRNKYAPPDEREAKLEQLRRLDASVDNKATALSLTVGIIGTLLFGFGMSCVLVWSDKLFFYGLIFGLIGVAVCAAAYPLFKAVSEKKRKEIAPLIVKLADELLK